MAAKKIAKGTLPNYNVAALNKRTEVRGKIGVAWTKSDGSISIKLNAFIMLDTADPDLIITLFPYDRGDAHSDSGNYKDHDREDTATPY